MNILKYIGVFHLCGMMLENLYGIIIQKHILLDKLYFVSVIMIPLSWILCKDECLVSYLVKKYKNPEYVLGSEPADVNDIEELFTNRSFYNKFCHINHGLRMVSMILVNNRTTKISYLLLVPTFILYTIYIRHVFFIPTYNEKSRELKGFFLHIRPILAMHLLAVLYTINDPFVKKGMEVVL